MARRATSVLSLISLSKPRRAKDQKNEKSKSIHLVSFYYSFPRFSTSFPLLIPDGSRQLRYPGEGELDCESEGDTERGEEKERAEVALRAIESIAKVFDLLDLSTC